MLTIKVYKAVPLFVYMVTGVWSFAIYNIIITYDIVLCYGTIIIRLKFIFQNRYSC